MELSERKERIDNELREFFSSEGVETERVEGAFSKIPDFVLRGGKRVRPALFLEGYKIGGGEQIDECLRASLSIELCHNYFLMHDDVMDRDALRRGGKTLHKTYEDDFGPWTSISLAINTGDYANTLSFQSILDCDFHKERKFEAVRELVETQKKVYEGQCLDLILHETPLSEVEVEDVLRLHRLKTASYTVAGPLRMGFLLSPRASESDGTAESLRDYGREIGTAFQVKDDLLGLFGKKEETGKPITSDIEEGKRTLPLTTAYRRGTEDQREKMESIVGSNPSEEEFEAIKEIVEETGAKRKCEEMAEEMVEEGKGAVESVESGFLTDLADFIVERSY